VVVAVAGARDVARGLVAGLHGLLRALTVAVGVDVPDAGVRGVDVDLPVAVVVDFVADFLGGRVDVGVGVVAIVGVGHQVGGPVASVFVEESGVSVAVRIVIEVPGVAVVDLVVTVVVEAIADLVRAGVDGEAGVVAVERIADVTVRRVAGEHGVVRVTVAILVQVAVPGGLLATGVGGSLIRGHVPGHGSVGTGGHEGQEAQADDAVHRSSSWGGLSHSHMLRARPHTHGSL